MSIQHEEVNVKEMTPYEQAKAFYHCDHESNEIRYKIYTNGTKHYFSQCLTCGGALTTAIPHRNIKNIDNCVEWDQGLENGYRFLIDEMANDLQNEQYLKWQARNTQWDQAYNDYLQSEQWQDKRRRVLARDNYLCQACLKRKATQVHHTTYKFPLGQEPLFILVSVCKACHDALHDLSPNSREVSNG